MSEADEVRSLALSLVGQDYYLGEEPWYVIGWEQTKVELDTDCSGLVFGVMRKAGVLWHGYTFPRLTAHGYWQNSEPLSKPSKVGDLGYLMRGGRVYHTFMYVGYDDVVEAGDGTGKVGLHTVAHENKRGAKWGRLPIPDLGELTQGDGDLTPEEHNLLKELRQMVAVKQSFCNAITNALLIGDKEEARRLNDEAWAKFPEGKTGLPKGWRP